VGKRQGVIVEKQQETDTTQRGLQRSQRRNGEGAMQPLQSRCRVYRPSVGRGGDARGKGSGKATAGMRQAHTLAACTHAPPPRPLVCIAAHLLAPADVLPLARHTQMHTNADALPLAASRSMICKG
jgi:hypothetical protein